MRQGGRVKHLHLTPGIQALAGLTRQEHGDRRAPVAKEPTDDEPPETCA
jgi:hypothetical protein